MLTSLQIANIKVDSWLLKESRVCVFSKEGMRNGIELINKKGGFFGGSVVKNPPSSAGDTGSIPGSGRSPGERNGNPLRYSCLGNSMGRGSWRDTVHEITKCQTQLSD